MADIVRYLPGLPPAQLVYECVLKNVCLPKMDDDDAWHSPECGLFVKLCVASDISVPTRDVRPEQLFDNEVRCMCAKLALSNAMHHDAGPDTPIGAVEFVTDSFVAAMVRWHKCTASEAHMHAFSTHVEHQEAKDSARNTTFSYIPSENICIVTTPQHAHLDIPKVDKAVPSMSMRDILNEAIDTLDADEQKQFFSLGNGMTSFFEDVRYGAALSIPQPALPEPLYTLQGGIATCNTCSGTWGCTAAGEPSGLVGELHTKCGGQGGATIDFARQGGIMACHGIVQRHGTWFFEVSDWPLSNRDSCEITLMHPHTILLSTEITKAHRRAGRWLMCDKVTGATSLPDMVRRCNIPPIPGISKRESQKIDTLRGALCIYGHAMVTGHLPFASRYLPNGRLTRVLPNATPGFAERFQTRHPADRTCMVPHALITPGPAMCLMQLCVYDHHGYCSTLQCLQRIAARSKLVTHDIDVLVLRWIHGNHPMVEFPFKTGPPAVQSEVTAMHEHVFTALLSAKTRRRISVSAPPSVWCVEHGSAVFSGSPVNTLSRVVGISEASVLAAMYGYDPWNCTLPVLSHVRPFIDVHTVLPVRVTMNPSAYPSELQRLLDGLEAIFGEDFATGARETWFKNERHNLPEPLTRATWMEFRALCLKFTSYGLAYYYMAVYDNVTDMEHAADRGTDALDIHARMEPPVQRGVPWMGGWTVPRAAVISTDGAFVDLGHGDARYYAKMLPVCRRIYAFEIDLVAIRSAWAALMKLDLNDVMSKVCLVPVSWENLYLDDLSEPCIVAAAYRPGTAPPFVGKADTHMFTAECSGVPSWDRMELNSVDVFVHAVAPSSRWRHRTNSPEAAAQAACCWKAYKHQQEMESAAEDHAAVDVAQEVARRHLNMSAFNSL
tara:strand:- start:9622 stop:12300 length:2679 start_codon:yes stop_codon:yes gene_type:complete